MPPSEQDAVGLDRLWERRWTIAVVATVSLAAYAMLTEQAMVEVLLP